MIMYLIIYISLVTVSASILVYQSMNNSSDEINNLSVVEKISTSLLFPIYAGYKTSEFALRKSVLFLKNIPHYLEITVKKLNQFLEYLIVNIPPKIYHYILVPLYRCIKYIIKECWLLSIKILRFSFDLVENLLILAQCLLKKAIGRLIMLGKEFANWIIIKLKILGTLVCDIIHILWDYSKQFLQGVWFGVKFLWKKVKEWAVSLWLPIVAIYVKLYGALIVMYSHLWVVLANLQVTIAKMWIVVQQIVDNMYIVLGQMINTWQHSFARVWTVITNKFIQP